MNYSNAREMLDIEESKNHREIKRIMKKATDDIEAVGGMVAICAGLTDDDGTGVDSYVSISGQPEALLAMASFLEDKVEEAARDHSAE